MAGEFGRFINEKRIGRADGGGDILVKDLAAAIGTSATYLSDIIKGRRNPPDIKTLEKISQALKLTDAERTEMLDFAGRERNEAAPDLPDYLMDENIPHVRVALRKATNKRLGDEFWKQVADTIDEE